MQEEWPCGRPVELVWADSIEYDGEVYCGETWREGRTIVISLSKRKCRTWDAMIETLIHEYTHAIQWGPASVESHRNCKHHPAAFYAQQGEILDEWNHKGGHIEANRYAIP